MTELVIINLGADISDVIEVASELNYRFSLVEHDIHKLDTFSLKPYSKCKCFIAFKNSFLGLPIKYLFREAQLRNIELINLICPSSIISKNIQIGSNVFIGRSVTVKNGAIIKNCIMINKGSTIGVDSFIDSYTYLGTDVQIFSNSRIDSHCFIGDCAVITSPSIGEFCCLEMPIVYSKIFPSGTHFLKNHRSFINPFQYH